MSRHVTCHVTVVSRAFPHPKEKEKEKKNQKNKIKKKKIKTVSIQNVHNIVEEKTCGLLNCTLELLPILNPL